MRHLSLLIIGMLMLSACSPQPSGMGMHRGRRNHRMMHGDSVGFLPGQDVDLASLPEAKPSEIIDVEDGESIELHPMLIRNKIGDTAFAMYGYNGQFPGPTLKVKQGSTFTVRVNNRIDQPTTVHWHGIRLENPFDGAAGVTQKAIEPGNSFTYTVTVPDEGIFWYHPHVREDIQQDMGLYGIIHVTPNQADAYPPVDQEQYIFLDDVLLDENNMPLPYGTMDANYALMGRFGNWYLVNGEYAIPGLPMSAPRQWGGSGKSTMRFYLINTANTRTFNLSFSQAQMIQQGGDNGRLAQPAIISQLILGPSERAIVDVNYTGDEGVFELWHHTVHDGAPSKDLLAAFLLDDQTVKGMQPVTSVIPHADIVADMYPFQSYFDKPIDKTLHLTAETGMGHMGHGMMMDHASTDGIEWEDTMAMMNQMSNKSNVQWKLIDEETGNENMDMRWKFKKGDVVKIRIINDAQEQGSDHPMQHPIHLHGQRFLVLNDNGMRKENFGWKDTVLVPAGHTVDLLVDMSNPGDWMIHCHIAEHLSNGMMGMFTVAE